MPETVLAAQLYTVRDFLKTPQEIQSSLEKVRSIGYEAVQLSALGPIEPRALRKIADDLGLRIVATHVDYERIRSDVRSVIEEHEIWSCKNVAIGSMPESYRDKDGFARFAREASAAVVPLIEAGLTFSYHNHSFEFERIDHRTGMEILFEESDPGSIFAELDTYWVQHGGANPVTWIRKLADRICIVHLKDMSMQGFEQKFAEVGEGNLEWEPILAACRDAGVEWYIVEQDICPGDPFQSLEQSLHNLRNMGLN